MKGYKTPLSSDAFSNFGKIDRAQHDKEVEEATLFLHESAVATAKSLSNISSHASLVQILHSKGINLRLIGKMIPHANDKAAKVFLIEEMISRIIKHHIRDRYQTEMEEKLLVFQESFRKISCDVLNRLLDPNNDLWIFVRKEAKQRYEFDLTQDDLSIISVYSIIKVSLFFSLSFLFLLLILKLISLSFLLLSRTRRECLKSKESFHLHH